MKQITRLVVTLFIITSLTAAALAGVNSITKDRIAHAKEEKNRQAMALVLPDCENLAPIPFTDSSGMVRQVYAPDGNPACGSFAVKVTPSGFGGEITMMVGIREGSISGISIVSHSETPSLGAEAAANNRKGNAFREQFSGLKGPLAVTKDGGQVEAITSATITSRAVTAGADAALACVRALD